MARGDDDGVGGGVNITIQNALKMYTFVYSISFNSFFLLSFYRHFLSAPALLAIVRYGYIVCMFHANYAVLLLLLLLYVSILGNIIGS